MKYHRNPAPGYRFIFRRWITDKNGNRIYPKNGRAFCLEVPIDSER
jgi:hypothetical protein